MEQKLVGRWQWTYIEGVGEMTFTRDHKITVAFPQSAGSRRGSLETNGTWHLEGDTLVLVPEGEWLRRQHELDPQSSPTKAEVQRHRIIQLDENRLVCDDQYTLQRAK